MNERMLPKTRAETAERYLREGRTPDKYELSAKVIRLTQMIIAENYYRDSLMADDAERFEMPDGSKPTFAHYVESVTPFARDLHGDEGGIHAKLTDTEKDKINDLYYQGGLSAVLPFVDSLVPPSTGMAHLFIPHKEEDVLFKDKWFTVFEKTMEADSELFPELKERDRYIVIDLAPPYVYRKEGEDEQPISEDNMTFELLKVFRRIAEEVRTRNIKGVLVDTWILDAFPEGNNFGFERKELFENETDSLDTAKLASHRYTVSWQQLLRQDGTVNWERFRKTMEKSELPYSTKLGFLPKVVLLEKYLKSNK
ncbi:hypothetical protein HY968_00510 [Candidatus Kaiserbacteria bacterium]|nr:hypothetical protein [Candidatus Kaiserbacteria bacterium]